MDTKWALMDRSHYIDLACLDEAAAEHLLDAYAELYEAASDEPVERDIFAFDLTAPTDKQTIKHEFCAVVERKIVEVWCLSLTDDQARCLIDLLAPNGYTVKIIGGVEISADDIRNTRTEGKE